MIDVKSLLKKSAPVRDAVLSLHLGARSCPVIVRRNQRARRMTLRVMTTTGTVQITAPIGVRLTTIEAFLSRHRHWVEQRLTRLPERHRFTPGALVPLRGVAHRLAMSGHVRGLVSLEVDGTETPVLIVPGDAPHLERRLIDYLKAQARHDLDIAVALYSAKIAVKAKRLVIRDGATRWGSCAANGVLSFSWRLIFSPPFVLDYVAAHEVAHLRHMNHGPDFWALLREICPNVDQAQAWMKAHGSQLHHYGPPPGKRQAAASATKEAAQKIAIELA